MGTLQIPKDEGVFDIRFKPKVRCRITRMSAGRFDLHEQPHFYNEPVKVHYRVTQGFVDLTYKDFKGLFHKKSYRAGDSFFVPADRPHAVVVRAGSIVWRLVTWVSRY